MSQKAGRKVRTIKSVLFLRAALKSDRAQVADVKSHGNGRIRSMPFFPIVQHLEGKNHRILPR